MKLARLVIHALIVLAVGCAVRPERVDRIRQARPKMWTPPPPGPMPVCDEPLSHTA